MSRLAYYIVIAYAGDEPMGVAAPDAKDIRAELGDVALCAPTTLAALLRAGWTEDRIYLTGEAQAEERAA